MVYVLYLSWNSRGGTDAPSVYGCDVKLNNAYAYLEYLEGKCYKKRWTNNLELLERES